MNIDFKKIFNKVEEAFLTLLGCCVIIGLFAFMIFGVSLDVNESYVGKRVVIDGDTTTITNYSRGGWGVPYGFNLSNGCLLDPDAVEQFIIE